MKFQEMAYERPDMAKAIAEAEAMTEGVRNAGSAETALELHERFTRLIKYMETMKTLCEIRHTIDTKDACYDAENDFFDENEPIMEKIIMDFYKELVNSPHRVQLDEVLGELLLENAELSLKGFDERIIEELQKENALSSKYEKLLASASLDFDGKKLNLSQLAAYQKSGDRAVRKAAYAKRTEFFMEHENELDEIFDEMVKLRDKMAKKLGYKNYVELGYIKMHRNSYDEAAVRGFRDRVKSTLVPYLRELHEQRRVDLSLDKLKFYDEEIYFPEGNPAPRGTPEEMLAAGRRMYEELSPETAEFIDFMLNNDLFDVLAKEGKAGGGYCTFLPDYKAPFVFANFNGTSDDVNVLTHECGHALCAFLARDIEIAEYQRYTYDIAEIHSMSMEFFTADWMDLLFGENSGKYLYMHLSSALAFIPYGCMVDEFQHIVYNDPGMGPARRKEEWSRLECEYKPHLDYDGDPFFGKGGTWQRQSHIYEMPFYYIDYCLAQVCALQYRLWMEKDKAGAFGSYLELLKKAGTRKFTGLVEEAGLASPLGPGCIESLIDGASVILGKLRRK